MTIDKFFEVSGGDSQHNYCACQKCQRELAEILWHGLRSPPPELPKNDAYVKWFHDNRDANTLLLCAKCAKEMCMGMLRDVMALEIGEELADANYRDTRDRLKFW